MAKIRFSSKAVEDLTSIWNYRNNEWVVYFGSGYCLYTYKNDSDLARAVAALQ